MNDANPGDAVIVDYDCTIAGADDIDAAYRNAREGRYGISKLTHAAQEYLDIGGELDWDWRKAKELRAWTDPVSLILPDLCARMVDRLGLGGRLEDEEIGLIGGSAFPGITPLANLERVGRTVKGMLCVTASVPMARVFLKHPFRGEFHYVSTACATGGHALLIARSLLMSQSSTRLFMVCCWDFPMIDVVLKGFRRAGTLFTYRSDDRARHDPAQASRPLSVDRAGLVPAEAVTIMVVTTRETARLLELPIKGVITGVASAGGARSHVLSDQRSIVGTIGRSLGNGHGREPLPAVDLISAHANSTEVGDETEVRALATAFGAKLADIPLVSAQEYFGHTFGASVLLQTMMALEMMHRREVLPMRNYLPDPNLPALRIARCVESQEIDRALVLGIGFGGATVSVAVSRDR
jgi:3-oxoacyl-(acyl-carrier-protein) synthase